MKYLKSYKMFIESLLINNVLYLNNILNNNNKPIWDKRKISHDSNNFENILNIIEKDCKPYLDILSNESKLLFKGTNHAEDFIDDGIYLKNVRKDRKPKDTKNDINEYISKLFLNKFNESIREIGTFTTKNPGVARDYGNEYIFIPIGEFYYYHNPEIEDLFTHIHETPWYLYKISDNKKDEYLNLYGEGTGNGEFYFNNIPYGNIEYEAVADILEEYDYYTENEVQAMLEWKPTIQFDEYSEKMENDYINEINKIVDGYIKNGKYDDITTQEVTIICDKYYLIETDYYSELIEYIKKNKK